MPIQKPIQQILSAATITPNATTAASTELQLIDAVLLALTVRLTFNASALNGAVLNVYGSHNNVHWDTQPYLTAQLSVPSGGGITQRSIAIIPAPAWLRCTLTNSDGSQNITDAIVYAQIQRVL